MKLASRVAELRVELALKVEQHGFDLHDLFLHFDEDRDGTYVVSEAFFANFAEQLPNAHLLPMVLITVEFHIKNIEILCTSLALGPRSWTMTF